MIDEKYVFLTTSLYFYFLVKFILCTRLVKKNTNRTHRVKSPNPRWTTYTDIKYEFTKNIRLHIGIHDKAAIEQHATIGSAVRYFLSCFFYCLWILNRTFGTIALVPNKNVVRVNCTFIFFSLQSDCRSRCRIRIKKQCYWKTIDKRWNIICSMFTNDGHNRFSTKTTIFSYFD